MKRFQVLFCDKNSSETRQIAVEATTSEEAETKACDYADENKWPESFRVEEIEEIENGKD